ncbi:MAG: hypothetical protein KatS3mg031_1750 [Chitinophagales bacterium]|nr:MAG: hypothetical protein KatS3mg031_1750 [Chitinophagales bacterium]
MWDFWREYFTFTTSQRNGIIVLLILIVLLVITSLLLPVIIRPDEADFSRFRAEIEAFERQSVADNGQPHRVEQKEVALFYFDPNNLSEDAWKQLGLPDKIVRTIMSYRARGGRFYRKEDLKKIYGMQDTFYVRLEPYIQIATPEDDEEAREVMDPFDHTVKKDEKADRQSWKLKRGWTGATAPAQPRPTPIDINTADSADLVSIHGIGPVLSKRILRYRERLGGFIHIHQLLEVYGIDTAKFPSLAAQLYADTTQVRKMHINYAGYDELARHPYIGAALARVIVNYRTQHGPFTSRNDLLNMYVMHDSLLQKIEPYLLFSQEEQ